MIRLENSGNFKKTRDFIKKATNRSIDADLKPYGDIGVQALSAATPRDTGLTAQSWRYRIVKDRRGTGIEWYNTNSVNGTPVAILIQYGHATRSGSYIIGRDFINPAMKPVFDRIAEEIWKKVKA